MKWARNAMPVGRYEGADHHGERSHAGTGGGRYNNQKPQEVTLRKQCLLVCLTLAAALGTAAATAPGRAEQIEVGNYAVSANGMPYAIAMAKGYFKDAGANVTGIITSA